MKIIKKLSLVLASFCLILMNCILPAQALEAFAITDYHVEMIVGEDGVITVTETMSTEFSYPRHGIYVNIPGEYTMNWNLDGKNTTRNYVFPISDVDVLSNHDFSVDTSNHNVQIKIGSGDYYANTQETYVYRYKIHTKDLNLDSYQALYHNIVGKWDTTIDHLTFLIQMPKEFDESRIEFYIGNDLDNVNNLKVEVNGNTIYGTYGNTLSPNESVTIYLPLDENYFVYPDYSAIPWLIVGVSVLLLLGIAFIFLKVGKDDPLVIPVEFEAPEGVTSAECGYIVDGSIDNRDIISLILDWGRKGYLGIEEADEELVFSKNKEADEAMTTYEKRMFNALFHNGDVVSTVDLSQKFYTSIDQCKIDLNRFMKKKENRIFTGQSIGFRALTYCVTLFPTILLITIMYWCYSYSLLGLVISIIPLVLLVIVNILLAIEESQRRSIHGALRLLYLILSLILFAGYALYMLGFSSLCNVNFISTLLVILVTALLCLFAQRMIKRTERGQRLYGEVLGLRQFILVAEKDRLEMLAKDNPMIFYDILPYAYAFNLTEVWSDHFAGLLIPEVDWYVTSDPTMRGYMMGHALSRSMAHAQSQMISTPPAKGGSGGFSGGGGGFGGGGFGGSSGGSW